MTMYAVKFQNGRVALLGALPDDAADSFEFDLSELPNPHDEECSYTLDVDFENKSFALVPNDVPEEEEPTEMEQLRADVDYIAVMTGVEL